MDTNKQHRLLSDSELFSILESSDAELDAAEEKLGSLAGQIFDGIYEPGVFTRLVKAGAFQAATVRIADEPKFVLIYSRTALGWLTIEGVATLKRCPVATIFAAVDELATHYKAKTIQCVTKLSAMARMAKSCGWYTTGLVLHKNAPAT